MTVARCAAAPLVFLPRHWGFWAQRRNERKISNTDHADIALYSTSPDEKQRKIGEQAQLTNVNKYDIINYQLWFLTFRQLFEYFNGLFVIKKKTRAGIDGPWILYPKNDNYNIKLQSIVNPTHYNYNTVILILIVITIIKQKKKKRYVMVTVKILAILKIFHFKD